MQRKPLLSSKTTLELMLIIVVVGLAALFRSVPTYKLVTLNLFYLPVVLCGFFLGTYRAGILAVFSVIAVSAVAMSDLSGFIELPSPLIVGLVVTVWGAVLGLVSMLVGTLSDERLAKLSELHEAYVGVVEVLSRYLQSANPLLKARSIRVAELSQRVAAAMRMPRQQIDDVRIAALLFDIGNVEVTTRVFRKAVGMLETSVNKSHEQHTFRGIDLIQSLGSVLSGATPLMVHQDDVHQAGKAAVDAPLGTRIIWVVRAYDDLTEGQSVATRLPPEEALAELRRDHTAGYDVAVLEALSRSVVQGTTPSAPDVEHDWMADMAGAL
ncbi:MAG TPA: HD domain-containing phosphohydrolase [Pirellulales bacterium]|nr:HD domain-containing phosphohydrolase [Pirellulales bacterium]